ncbi:hypothetical protein M231_02368 [Tremella mesenterica]|uniref:Uncharacterized protein n=1 Tax=Tremella mesenterica TaxID=5217 RepID=A0A4Q1BR01_TREME|nr:hypothetical protein M231_02368 [Tremella mesenterica]
MAPTITKMGPVSSPESDLQLPGPLPSMLTYSVLKRGRHLWMAFNAELQTLEAGASIPAIRDQSTSLSDILSAKGCTGSVRLHYQGPSRIGPRLDEFIACVSRMFTQVLDDGLQKTVADSAFRDRRRSVVEAPSKLELCQPRNDLSGHLRLGWDPKEYKKSLVSLAPQTSKALPLRTVLGEVQVVSQNVDGSGE